MLMQMFQLWLNLADQYIVKHSISWKATCAAAFSERITVEDDRLGMQIIKVSFISQLQVFFWLSFLVFDHVLFLLR